MTNLILLTSGAITSKMAEEQAGISIDRPRGACASAVYEKLAKKDCFPYQLPLQGGSACPLLWTLPKGQQTIRGKGKNVVLDSTATSAKRLKLPSAV
jgi:hypothetical protein